jgi:short-subunit dehydrogenase
MGVWWRQQLARRPWWMNVLMVFCAYLAFVYVPWDFFCKPVARDAEVWFGIVLHGWAAKATEPVHWLIYLCGAYGFWRMRAWMWPWAALYVGQVALATLLWNIVHVGGWSGWVGGVVSAGLCGGLAAVLWQARDRFAQPGPPLRERYGQWAVITGASAGIGAEFARALAHEGLSCVLVARRQDRLQALAAELERTWNVSTRTLAVDLGAPDGAEQLLRAVEDLEVGVLVNNAGFGYAGRFDKQETERLRSMVQLNCVAPVILTSRLLPAMRARRRGAVIITGSIAGAQPVPFNGVYSATKAFDRYFGEALWAELQGTGVDVLVLEPGPTDTEFQAVAGETAHAGEPPAQVVSVALAALARQPSVVSGWFNWLRSNSSRFFPRSIVALIAGQVMIQWTPAEMR